MSIDVETRNDARERTAIQFHCANECPMADIEKDWSTANEHDTYPCGYRHWCPWCGDCEYCYGEGPHDWD
jgi:hypothetical protein